MEPGTLAWTQQAKDPLMFHGPLNCLTYKVQGVEPETESTPTAQRCVLTDELFIDT